VDPGTVLRKFAGSIRAGPGSFRALSGFIGQYRDDG